MFKTKGNGYIIDSSLFKKDLLHLMLLLNKRTNDPGLYTDMQNLVMEKSLFAKIVVDAFISEFEVAVAEKESITVIGELPMTIYITKLDTSDFAKGITYSYE